MGTEQILMRSIRAIQRITGETQGDLAEVLGIQINNMNKRLNGRIHFSFNELDLLAAHWKLVPTELLISPAFAQARLLEHHMGNTPNPLAKSAVA